LDLPAISGAAKCVAAASIIGGVCGGDDGDAPPTTIEVRDIDCAVQGLPATAEAATTFTVE
jgi:hypothetical protein